MVDDLTSSVRRNYCMHAHIPFIHCSQKTVDRVQVLDVLAIKPQISINALFCEIQLHNFQAKSGQVKKNYWPKQQSVDTVMVREENEN